MSLILLVIVIVLIINNGHLRDEIEDLKRKNYNYCPKCGHELNKKVENITTINQPVKNTANSKVNKQVTKPKNTISDEEVKNNIILITGSILIVLAAVIYLTSSWSSTSNILKCLVIFIMFFVFVIASYIAKEKLKLTQTARAFKYIALAYLPLSLISLSIFGLLGERFSINGELQNLYFGITFIICSIIYYLESKDDKDLFLSISTIISSILGIIFLVLAFTNSFIIVLMFLYLYSYFLALLYSSKKYIYNEKFMKVLLITIFYTLFGSLIILNIYLLAETDISKIKIIQNMILLVLDAGLSIFLGNKQLNKFLVPISIVLVFSFIRLLGDYNTIISSIIVMLSIPIVYLYNYINEKKVNIISFIISLLLLFIIFYANLISFKESIPLFVISLLSVILLVVTYYLNDKLKKAITWMLPIFIELTSILLVIEYNLSVNILLGISTLLVATSIIPKLKDYTKEIVIIPSILNAIYILIVYENCSLIAFLLILVSIIVYYLLFFKINKNYKYPMYIFINLGMIYLGHIICGGLNAYTMAISIILIIALEVIDERLKDNGNFTYILIDYFITALYLTDVNKRTAFIMTIIISLVLSAYLLDNKKNIALYNIPLLTPFLYIGTSKVMIFGNINVMVILSILIIVTIPFLLLKDKKYITLAFVPYVYLLMQTSMNISMYIPSVLALCVSIVYLLLSDKQLLFKILTMITSLLLYYMIIGDLKLNATIFTIGILLIYTLFITRNIMKQVNDVKPLEYILFIVLNFIAITSYTSEADGMLYVILLLIITIFSYIKKYGPAFLISIIFILVNMFLLTRLFWLSIPWWLYVLGVGIILILFAVLNEINEKSNIKEKIIDFKNNLKL